MQIHFVSQPLIARQQDENKEKKWFSGKCLKVNVWLTRDAYEICSWTESVKKHVILFSVVQFITLIEWLRSLDKGKRLKVAQHFDSSVPASQQQASMGEKVKKRKKVNKFSICSSCSFSLLMILQPSRIICIIC